MLNLLNGFVHMFELNLSLSHLPSLQSGLHQHLNAVGRIAFYRLAELETDDLVSIHKDIKRNAMRISLV